jgi:hypothetical protein
MNDTFTDMHTPMFDIIKYIHHNKHYGPGVDSASNRNEYQESSWGVEDDRCVWLAT